MAREVAQLTFIKLWEFRHTLSSDHSFDTQLFRMANGALIDHLRRDSSNAYYNFDRVDWVTDSGWQVINNWSSLYFYGAVYF